MKMGEFIDQMINNIQLAYKLKTYKTCNLMVRFSKYEFNNKLFSGVILLQVTLGVTLTQPIKNNYIKKEKRKADVKIFLFFIIEI